MKKIFTKFSVLTVLCLVLFSVAIAQNVSVSGVVKDEASSPVSFATVTIKGTNKAVQTDASGAFTISAPSNSTLVISYIGYITQEIAVNGKSNIEVSLKPDTKNLEQVVVVGYGTQKKKDLTGSITSVNGDEVSKMPAVNPLASLQGKVAGLTVVNSGGAGSQPVIRIRGISSTNSANPLYVVDGLLQDNIDYLNPADIESIDLLRDASSAAIYGLRGSNGVIAITTKRAARGQTRVNFTSNVGIQRVTNKIDVTDAEGFKKLYSAQLANINAAPFDYTNYTGNTNWQDLIMRDAAMTSNSLSFSNSGEKTTTLINLGYNSQEGILKNENYQKFVVRLNEEIRVTDKFKVGANVTGFHAISNPTSAGLNNALWAAPIVNVQTDANTYYAMPSFQRAQVGNPIASLNRNDNTSINKAFRFNGSVFGELKFLKDFTLKSTLYADYGFSHGRGYTRPPYTMINLGENGAPTTTTVDQNFRSTISQYQNESHRYQQDHTLTFEKNLDGGHQITAVAGFTTLRWASSSLNGSRTDSTLVVPGDPDLWYLGIINANNILSNSGGGSEETTAGAFARVSYSFNGKYLFNGTIRRDGSSRFSPENRWGTFGSVGLGWVASEESFLKNQNVVDYLKIRASWGRLGNSNGVQPNLYQQGLSTGSTAIFGDNVYTAVQNAYIPDPNLRYEVVQGTDIGFDLRAIKNRFNLEVNFYDKTTDGILTSFPLLAGQLPYFTNLGKISNKGIEVSLGWNDKLGSDFSYGIAGNFSYNKNRVESLGNTTEFQITGNSGVNLTNSGYSIGYFYGYKQIGIYQTAKEMLTQPGFTNSLPGDIMYADMNGDGVISPLDRTYLGSPFPPYSYGMSLTLGYKGFDALIEGQGVWGNKIYTQRRTANFATLNYESNRLNAWTVPGSTNVEPILDNTRGNNFLFSSYYLEPGDYFRIRTLQVGYTFGKSAMDKIGIQKMRLFLSGQNLKTWTKATGYTPEAQIGSILGGGADNGVYPVPAIYSLGLNVTF